MPKGYSKRNQKGWNHTEESKRLISSNRLGLTANEKNPRWVGDLVSYPALHNWVRKHFIKPRCCDLCKCEPGVDSLGRTKIHWAAKIYSRLRKDWLALCSKCHRNYDYGRLKENKINCAGCGLSFETKNKKKKYCSSSCYKKIWRSRN